MKPQRQACPICKHQVPIVANLKFGPNITVSGCWKDLLAAGLCTSGGMVRW